MAQEKRSKMTTIKVTQETASVLALAVRSEKAKGDKKTTADRLLRRILGELYPEIVQFIEQGYGEAKEDDSQGNN